MPVSLPDHSRRNRFLLWMAHRATGIYAATFLLTVSADLTGARILIGLSVAGLVATLGLYLIRRHHGLTLCPLCAIATPLNGPEQAQRRAQSLRCAHWMWSRRAGVPIDLWIAVGAAEAYVMSVHRVLQPWCPQCHWDDEGDQELVPDPVPPSGAEVVA